MKKIALIITIVIIVFLQACFMKTYAISLDAVTDYNMIDISITTKSGIVRAMSATFKITGDVSFDTFQWSNEFKDVNLKSYQKEDKTLTVYVTPGNKSTLAIDGRIHIGRVSLSGVTKPKDYSIELTDITLADGEYKEIDEKMENTIKKFVASGTSTEEPDKPSIPDEPKDISSSKYTIKNGYISKIELGSTVKTLKSNITGNIIVKDKNGNSVSDTSECATGMIVQAGDKTYTLVIAGDIDGNAKISVNDLAKLKLHYIGKESLQGAYKEAADVDQNGSVSLNDIAKIKLTIIGK